MELSQFNPPAVGGGLSFSKGFPADRFKSTGCIMGIFRAKYDSPLIQHVLMTTKIIVLYISAMYKTSISKDNVSLSIRY